MKPAGIRIPLVELGARFYRYTVRDVPPDQFVDGIRSPSGKRVEYVPCDTLVEADGVWFRCPKCYHAANSDAGVHHVMCWFEGRVPDEANPGPGRWTPSGTGLADLTFVPGERIKAVSVQLNGGCRWHGFIAGGVATVPPS